MISVLEPGLSSKSGLIRKSAAALLQLPKWFDYLRATQLDFVRVPPVFANSVPKSGTHLLIQVVSGLPGRVNYGGFLASMTSSFRYRERSPTSVRNYIKRMVPGETVRGHLFFEARYMDDLANRNVVNYFIYRDPRDVALSGAHYARSMNPWHRLHRYFRSASSMDDAITLAIVGLQPSVPGVYFPDIGQRFGRYCGWLDTDDCFAIRYEDLQSGTRRNVVRKMAKFYAAHTPTPVDLDACVEAMLSSIAPSKSHTFRSGVKSGWREAFTPEHRRLFHEIAGDLLIKLGYEKDASWVTG